MGVMLSLEQFQVHIIYQVPEKANQGFASRQQIVSPDQVDELTAAEAEVVQEQERVFAEWDPEEAEFEPQLA